MTSLPELTDSRLSDFDTEGFSRRIQVLRVTSPEESVAAKSQADQEK